MTDADVRAAIERLTDRLADERGGDYTYDPIDAGYYAALDDMRAASGVGSPEAGRMSDLEARLIDNGAALREQVAEALWRHDYETRTPWMPDSVRPEDRPLDNYYAEADAVLAVVRERLARGIQQIPHTRAWVPDAEGEARNRGLDEALALVRGVGEAKP